MRGACCCPVRAQKELAECIRAEFAQSGEDVREGSLSQAPPAGAQQPAAGQQAAVQGEARITIEVRPRH